MFLNNARTFARAIYFVEYRLTLGETVHDLSTILRTHLSVTTEPYVHCYGSYKRLSP